MRKVILFTSTNIKWAVLDIENSPFSLTVISPPITDSTKWKFVTRNRINEKPNDIKRVRNPDINDSSTNKQNGIEETHTLLPKVENPYRMK